MTFLVVKMFDRKANMYLYANNGAELSGTQQLQVRCGANAERVFQSDPGRQGLRAKLEEVHL